MKDTLEGHVVPAFLRDGRYREVAGVFDEEPPWIFRKLVPLLSSNIMVDRYVVERIQELAKEGPIVYALKYPSAFDLYFLRIRCAQLGLPVPCFVFGMSAPTTGSVTKWLHVSRRKLTDALHRGTATAANDKAYREILEAGGAGVLYLVDERSSQERYVDPGLDPITILLDLQGRLAGSIVLVPMFILYDRTQRRTIRPIWESFLGDPDRPGPLKRLLIALRKWTVPEVLVGEPVYLIGEFEEFGSDASWEELPFAVRQKLIAAINARIRVNRGPERRSRTEIRELVLQDRRLQAAVREEATREGTTEVRVRKKVVAYVDEIAGDQHIQVHHCLYYLLKWLFSRVFDGIDLKQADFVSLKVKNQQGSLIYVSCHKSHFDYLLVGFLSFINQMAIPYMAAGKNLSFWPVGSVLRNAGAFFIRRSFKGKRLYTQVFSAYLKVLVQEKININFYIEGGRSRTGKLMPPRLGMLSFLLQTIEEDAVDDLAFVPTFLGYDQVPEEKSYLRELTGREKQKESIISFFRARKILSKRFGKVYVRFHEPVSFREFCTRRGVSVGPGMLSLEEHGHLVEDFAYYLMSGIARAGVVTPVELVAAALTSTGEVRVAHETLLDAVVSLCEALHHTGTELAVSLGNLNAAVERSLELFQDRGLVEHEREDETAGKCYRIVAQKRASLEFYRNALINYLWSQSLVAAVLFMTEAPEGVSPSSVLEDFRRLRDLLGKELTVDPLVSDEELIEDALKLIREKGWDTVGLTGERARGLRYLRGITADLLRLYELVVIHSGTLTEVAVSPKELIKAIGAALQKDFAADGVRALPSLPSVMVHNALTRCAEMGLLEFRDGRKVIGVEKAAGERNAVQEMLARAVG